MKRNGNGVTLDGVTNNLRRTDMESNTVNIRV